MAEVKGTIHLIYSDNSSEVYQIGTVMLGRTKIIDSKHERPIRYCLQLDDQANKKLDTLAIIRFNNWMMNDLMHALRRN